MKRFVWFRNSLGLVCVSCLVAVLMAPAASAAEPPLRSAPDSAPWATNGPVHAIAIDADGTTYIGGEFTRVFPVAANGAMVEGTTGSVIAPSAVVDGYVSVAVPDGAGGFYIGGDFTKVGGLVRRFIAHVLASGAADPVFRPKIEAEVGGWYPAVCAIAVSGSTVYVGGTFSSVGGQNRSRIVALDATTGAVKSWSPRVTGAVVLSIAVSGSTVYIGGSFQSVGIQPRHNIAALSATTGRATAWNPDAGDPGGIDCVNALAVSGSTVYAGGRFGSIGGQTRHNIAALDAGSGLATAWDPDPSHWDPSASSSVNAVAVSGSTVYAGGGFTHIGGQDRNYIAALDATSGAATDWNPGAGDIVRALAVSDSTVYVGGDFNSIGGQTRHTLAALDAGSGLATAWDPDPQLWWTSLPPGDCSVNALAVSGSAVYVGGRFTVIGGLDRENIAALDGNGVPTAWDPGANSKINTLAVSGSTVYAGGWFDYIGGQDRNYIAALDATSGDATAWNPGADNGLNALAVSGSTVYAGGWFNHIGGQDRNYVAALNATSGAATAWDPNANSNVDAFAVSGSTVYAGGVFNASPGWASIGGQNRMFIAALDATTGAATSWNPGADNEVYTLAVSGSTIYAGGFFGVMGSQPRSCIAAIDAASGAVTAFNPSLNGPVYGIAVLGSRVYAGGAFGFAGSQGRTGIAALDPTTGSATSWAPQLTQGLTLAPQVYTLAVSGSKLYMGGDFTSVSGSPRPGFARFSTITKPMITSMRPSRGRVGITVTISGWNFGATRGTAKVFFGSKAATRYVSWSATKIKVKVPTLPKGKRSVTVRVGGVKSNAKTFTLI